MKKRKYFLLCLLLVCVVFSACRCGVTPIEEMLPALSEYAEWDGNYMYRGNVRVKTTGEDAELLVPEISYHGTTYTLGETSTDKDYRFIDDNTILLLALATQKQEDLTSVDKELEISSENTEGETTDGQKEQLPMLIKYHIREKSHDLIYVFENSDDDLYLQRISGDFAILREKKCVLVVDMINRTLNTFSYTKSAEVLNDCVILVDNTKISYAKYSDLHPTRLMDADNNLSYFIYDVNVSGMPLIRISHSGCYTFFNLQTRQLYEPDALQNVKSIRWITDELFILGEKNNPFNDDFYNYYISNCVLHKMSFADGGFSFEKLITFKSGFAFEESYGLTDGLLAIRFCTAIVRDVKIYKNYIYNPKTNELTTVTFEESLLEKRVPTYINELHCGDLVYYFESEGNGALWVVTYVHRLKSKNTVTGEEKLMQAFAENLNYFTSVEQCRFCEELFVPYNALNDNFLTVFGKIGESYIKILPY